MVFGDFDATFGNLAVFRGSEAGKMA